MRAYSLNFELRIAQAYPTLKGALARSPEGWHIVTSARQVARGPVGKEDLAELEAVVSGKPVREFLNKAEASEALFAALERMATPASERDEREQGSMRPAPSARLYPAGEAERGNPRRATTRGARSLEIIRQKPGITYAEFRRAGGRADDLNWDAKRGRVRLAS